MSKRSGMNYFSEDSAGFRVQPKTVLIMSLVYIGVVVLLHIYSKLGASPVAEQTTATPPPTGEQGQQQEAYTEETLWWLFEYIFLYQYDPSTNCLFILKENPQVKSYL